MITRQHTLFAASESFPANWPTLAGHCWPCVVQTLPCPAVAVCDVCKPVSSVQRSRPAHLHVLMTVPRSTPYDSQIPPSATLQLGYSRPPLWKCLFTHLVGVGWGYEQRKGSFLQLYPSTNAITRRLTPYDSTCLRCCWQTREMQCFRPTVLYTDVDGQCDKLVIETITNLPDWPSNYVGSTWGDQPLKRYGWCPPKFKWFTWPNHTHFREGFRSMG